MVDVPIERSFAYCPTYRGMGLATAMATLVAFVAATLFGWTYRSAGVFAAGGDDCCGDSMRSCLGVAGGYSRREHCASCGPAAGDWCAGERELCDGAGHEHSAANPWRNFIAGYINVANFMDGINGISGAHGLVAGLAYALTGWMVNLPWLALAGVAVAGAFAAFLPWNVRPVRNVFLGDAGSYVLGAALGARWL